MKKQLIVHSLVFRWQELEATLKVCFGMETDYTKMTIGEAMKSPPKFIWRDGFMQLIAQIKEVEITAETLFGRHTGTSSCEKALTVIGEFKRSNIKIRYTPIQSEMDFLESVSPPLFDWLKRELAEQTITVKEA